MIKKINTEQPDITLISERFKEKLEITIRDTEVIFDAYVDGDGNFWKINKKELMEKLK